MNQTFRDLEAWIRAEAVPIDLQSDAGFNERVDRLVAELGESIALLGMGEALHAWWGGEAILQFRNRLFQRLVERHGYSAIAIESSFPASRAINDFVTGRRSASYEAIQDSGFSHRFGRLRANRDLVEWMRQTNAKRDAAAQIHFYGFDSPTDMAADSPRQLLTFALDAFASIDSAAARKHRDVIEPLLGEDALWENPEAAMRPELGNGLSAEAVALRIAAENLISDLHVNRPQFAAAQGMARFLEATHYAAQARQLLNYHAVLATAAPDRQGRLLGIRGGMMADNLAYIASCERGKVLVFAHNKHLQRRKVEWQFGDEPVHWYPVGAHLEALFGSRYAVIGSAVGESAVNGIAKPEAGTLEALLMEAGAGVTLIPTHRGWGLPEDALNEMRSRSGSTTNGSYSALTGRDVVDFDWLVMFGEV